MSLQAVNSWRRQYHASFIASNNKQHKRTRELFDKLQKKKKDLRFRLKKQGVEQCIQ